MNPKAGKIFCDDTKRYRKIDDEATKNYEYTGNTRKVGSVRCAEFKCGNETFFQPWSSDANLRKKGEQNVSSKLNTRQVRAIVRAFFFKDKDITQISLARKFAEKYDVTPETIIEIAKGRAWKHVTIGYLVQLRAGNDVVENCVAATNKPKKAHKLSGSIAKFIVRDYMIHKLPVKVLAKKFCVSERSIQRILKGEAWREYTVPAIAEFSKWVLK